MKSWGMEGNEGTLWNNICRAVRLETTAMAEASKRRYENRGRNG